MILAGDVGGTSTRLAFLTVEGERLNLVLENDYPSRKHKSLDEIVGEFVLHHRLGIECACFGIAGPVQHGRVETPNLPWVVDQETIARALHVESAWLINDLLANTYGIPALEEKDFAVLNAGSPDASVGAKRLRPRLFNPAVMLLWKRATRSSPGTSPMLPSSSRYRSLGHGMSPKAVSPDVAGRKAIGSPVVWL